MCPVNLHKNKNNNNNSFMLSFPRWDNGKKNMEKHHSRMQNAHSKQPLRVVLNPGPGDPQLRTYLTHPIQIISSLG